MKRSQKWRTINYKSSLSIRLHLGANLLTEKYKLGLKNASTKMFRPALYCRALSLGHFLKKIFFTSWRWEPSSENSEFLPADMQMIVSFPKHSVMSSFKPFLNCPGDVQSWIILNFLNFNPRKKEKLVLVLILLP